MERKKIQKKPKPEIKAEYELYLQHKFKYPKSQLCYLYFKGDCINPSCQFAHGVKELHLDTFHSFLKDKEAYNTERRDQWQKSYFYKAQDVRPFASLIEYQNSNKELFQRLYTQEEIIANPRKRMEIRRVLNKQILSELIHLFLTKESSIEINKLHKLIEQIGYPFSIKIHLLPGIYFTKVIRTNKQGKALIEDKGDTDNDNDASVKKKAKKSSKKEYYCIFYPTNEAMMKRFIEIIDQYYLENPNCFNEVFPCSFYSLGRIINKRLKLLDPSPSHYVLKYSISHMEFIDLLCTQLIQTSTIPALRSKKIEEFIYKPKLEETIAEITENFWTKHFAIHSTQYALVEYKSFIDECFISHNAYLKEFEKQNENDMKVSILVKLNQMANLFYYDNTNQMFIFNYKAFGSYDIEDFSESYYHKRCELIDKEINDASLTLLHNEEEIQINKEYKSKPNEINESLSSSGCVLVDNEILLKTFITRIKQGVKEIAVDIEGKFQTNHPSINLIQFALNENEIYVIDVFTFINSNNTNSLTLLKTVLTALFENESILKIFFDGRRDVSALHTVFKICPINYVDLSAIYSALRAFKDQLAFQAPSTHQEANKSFDILIKSCFNYTMKGINTILFEYQNEHKVNPLKEKMHHLFNEEKYSYFTSRPINEEFLLYSALDVKYLIEAYSNMRIEMKTMLKPLYGEVKHIDLVLILISNGHLLDGCNYANRKTSPNTTPNIIINTMTP